MGGGKGGGKSNSAADMQTELARQMFAETSPLRGALIGNAMNFLGVPSTQPATGGLKLAERGLPDHVRRGLLKVRRASETGGRSQAMPDHVRRRLLKEGGLKGGVTGDRGGPLDRLFGGQNETAAPQAPHKFDLSASPVFAAMKDVTESQFGRAKDNVIGAAPEGGPLLAALTDLEGNRASDLVRNTGMLGEAEMQRAFDLVSAGTGGAIQAGGNAGMIQAQLAQAQATQSAGKAGALGTGAGAYAGLKAAGKYGGAPAVGVSSITFKDEIGPITVLDKLTTVPVNKWRYKGEQEIHIGPYAEDFNRAFGLGDKKYIYFIDFLGVLLGAVKELHDKMLEQ